MQQRRVWLLALAILGVPLAFAVTVEASYRLARTSNHGAFFPSHPQLAWWALFALCIGGGLLALWQALPLSRPWRVLCVALYSAPMFLLLQGVAFQVACANADCVW